MLDLYKDTRKLDAACIAAYGLTEEIMMENAAAAIEREIRSLKKPDSPKRRVLILCGRGNNGADGYALARRIRIDFDVIVFQCGQPQSPLCKLQAERAEKCGTIFFDIEDFTLEFLETAFLVVDCIFGSGFHGDLDEKVQILLNDVNGVDCYRIACDVPSGIRQDGTAAKATFHANLTVTMGALKIFLFTDQAKDFTGKIKCAELGVGRRLFENSSNARLKAASLLEKSDMILPHRGENNVNKGSFGHVAIAIKEKKGAAVISGTAALKFGAGLVTLTDLSATLNLDNIPFELMTATKMPEKVKAVAFGMGLGHDNTDADAYFDFLTANKEVSCVIDADACYSSNLKSFLTQRSTKTVLTPHPKEFKAILKNCDFGEYTVEECVTKKIGLVEKFCKTFPKVVLLVKGANPVIGYFDGYKMHTYINAYGSPCLAKAGSGDVLTGMIASLMAQDYKSIDATITASLAHALASRKSECDFSLTPFELIDNLKKL